MYDKFVDFYDNYFKSYINDDLWFNASVKVF